VLSIKNKGSSLSERYKDRSKEVETQFRNKEREVKLAYLR
jgi:hypothetical protein